VKSLSCGYRSTVRNELEQLWLLRHGQSLGNVANDVARVTPVDRLDIAERDMDVPLSELGCRQAEAFGRWLADEPADARPDVVISSPYVRAMDTARRVLDTAGMDVHVVRDERLREREFGILDLLTHQGVAAEYPREATRRDRIGKFYYRPPGGESWVDVALRLRSFRDSIVRLHRDHRLLVVTHEVPIILFRYLIEELDEPAALRLSRSGSLANCSLTTFVRDDGVLHLERDAWTAPLEREATPVTDEPDAAVAPR
jgi:broad specificity phosphatase PhoE